MKLQTTPSRARVAGFTLAEMCVTMAIFIFLVIAMVVTQLFCARVYTLAATKLTATASGRKAMNDMRDQIKSALAVEVGTYNPTNNSYARVADGLPQAGNALLLSWTNDLSALYGTIYFMNQGQSNICSVVISNNTVLTTTMITNVIRYITNYNVFDAEDSYTNIWTNYVNSRVIHMKFQFCQWEYPLAGIGNGAMYDYYQLQTRVAQRIPQPTY